MVGGGGGNSFWTPTENRPAMRAFVDSVRDRRSRRRLPRGPRLLVEVLALLLVVVAVYVALHAIT